MLPDRRIQKKNSWKYYRHTRQTLKVLVEFRWSCSAKKPYLNAENTAALPPAKEPGKMLILHQGVLVFIPYSFRANGSKRSRRTHVHVTIHPKGKAKPLGSGFQLPGFGSQLLGSGFQLPGSGSQLPGSGSQLPGSGSQLPTTLLPLFLAMYPRGSREQPGR
ncbi:hypothetical protein Bca4012_090161 [Brassica carinata]